MGVQRPGDYYAKRAPIETSSGSRHWAVHVKEGLLLGQLPHRAALGKHGGADRADEPHMSHEEASAPIDEYSNCYNNERDHTHLGWLTPKE